MKLLRHILSHLILISFLIAVVSVFYYRTLLLPADVVGKIDGITNQIYPPALKFASKRDYFWSIRGERIVSFDDLKFFENKESVAAKEITKPDSVSKEIAVVATVPVKKADVVLQDKSDDKKTTAIVVAVNEPSAESKAEPPPVETNTEKSSVETNTVKELPVVIKDSDTSSERDLLVNARNAFNQGNVKLSEKFYLELTQLDNDNPDTFGELGNVYYSQGKWDEAGQAYYEAAVRLIEEKNYNQVAYLQRVITGLNTEHAEKLAQHMMRK